MPHEGPDSIVPLLLGLTIILAAAKFAGWVAFRVGQPAVLGEILAGIAIGNLGLLGFHGLEWLRDDHTLAVLAELGVILLLFEVGLESTVEQMRRVGASAFLVAFVGVVTPFGLGWLVGAWLLPEHSTYVHLFLGAVLTATSVGITARVLRDLNASHSTEARIILGAAVIDDVMGLVILAAVSGVIAAANQGSIMSPAAIGWMAAKALVFLAGAVLLGVILAPRLLRLAARIRVPGILLTSGLIICLLFSYLAARAGLAPIVGAFAAGLILEGSYFERFEESRSANLESLLHPVSSLLVPIFFVLTGAHVDLASLAEPGVLVLAGCLTLAAWAGKQACSVGVVERGVNRLAVGLGMVPRGEVGLIFANIGATLKIGTEAIITPSTYAAVVIMVMGTTLVTPPSLQWSLRRRKRGAR